MMAIAFKGMRQNPWATILDSGVWTRGEADTHTIVVGRNAAPADPADLVMPEFRDIKETCGEFPAPDSVGSSEYQYNLKRTPGIGPRVCLWKDINAFQESFRMAADSLADLVHRKMTADNRNQVLQLSGVKAVVNSDVDFYATINGNEHVLGVPFKPGLEPNTQPNISLIKRYAQFLTNDLYVPQFHADKTKGGDAVPTNVKIIAGEGILEDLRNEIGVNESVGFLTAGGFQVGKKQVLSYVWEGPIRGLGFAQDPQPLRFSTWPANGVLDRTHVVPPEVPAVTNNGKINVRNPAYWLAPFEIMFMIGGKGAFVREVLKGTGTVSLGGTSFKFPDQYMAGELKFYVPKGACDAFQETGFHTYQIVRAIRPQFPHFILPIAFKRCLNPTLPYCVDNQLG